MAASQRSTPVLWLLCALCLTALAVALPTSAAESVKLDLADAEKFVANAETLLNDLNVKAARAQRVQSTFITDDTKLVAAEANERLIEALTKLVTCAAFLRASNWRFHPQTQEALK